MSTRSNAPALLAITAIRDTRHPAIDVAVKSVLFALASRMNSDGWAWPSMEVLAGDAGVHRVTAIEITGWLRTVGILMVDASSGTKSLTMGINVARLCSLPSNVTRTTGKRKIIKSAQANATYIPRQRVIAPTPYVVGRHKRKRVYARDKYACRYCHCTVQLTIDHVVPKRLGGSNDDSNLLTCCRSCNSRKGSRTPQDAGMHILEVR